MSTPVVIVTSGGIAVTESDNGIPVTVADNGYGIAVTVVTSGGMAVKGAGDPLAPGAPVLTWTSAQSDTTPNFDVTLPGGSAPLAAAENDDLVIYNQTDAAVYLTRTLSAADIIAVTLNLEASALSPGVRNFVAYLVRGAATGPNSNVVAVTISAARECAVPGGFMNSGAARQFARPGGYIVEVTG